MTAPANPYAMPSAPATATAPANPYAAPASVPANPYAAPTPAPVTVVAPVQQSTPIAAPVPVTVVAPVQQSTPIAAPAGGDPFSGPAAPEPRGPRLLEMYGRLILITPKLVEKRAVTDDSGNPKTVDRMTADVVILDGGPCAYGGNPEEPGGRQHDKTAQIPHRTRDMYISSVGLVSQCRKALEARKRGEVTGTIVLGRLYVGEKKGNNKPPYLISEPTEADKVIARAYLATVDPFGN